MTAKKKKVAEGLPTRGTKFLRRFVKKIDNQDVLVLPAKNAEKFFGEFLRMHNACGQGREYVQKFMKSAFGYQEFDVHVTTTVPATGRVTITARSREEAMENLSAKIKSGFAVSKSGLSANTKKIAGEVIVSKATSVSARYR